jgi:hypothetical protein
MAQVTDYLMNLIQEIGIASRVNFYQLKRLLAGKGIGIDKKALINRLKKING